MNKEEIFKIIWENEHKQTKAVQLLSDLLGISKIKATEIYNIEYDEYRRKRNNLANRCQPERDCRFFKSDKVCDILRKMYCTEEICSFYKKREY